jgi:hypothetical protein
MLLTAFMKLTKLIKISREINEYLQIALIDAVNVFEFERCRFFCCVMIKLKLNFVFLLTKQKMSQ